MINTYKPTRIAKSSRLAFGAFIGITAVGFAALPAMAADESHGAKEYDVKLLPLNNSGAYGTAKVMLQDKTLTVMFNAKGLQPNMVHDAHIHGMLNGTDATCPTMAQDVNGDGYVSVFEGAPAYGPIKVSLSKPITPPGPNPNSVLFAPYAGVDSNNFQEADAKGTDDYNQTITYNLSDAQAAAAYKGIMPLEAQEVVIHGAMSPESVDTAGGSSKIVYDELLPVLCGDIRNAMKGEPTPLHTPMPSMMPSPNMRNSQMDTMPDMHMMHDNAQGNRAQNVDQQISYMYEVRNATIDMLNRAGDVMARNTFLSSADALIEKFAHMVHMR